MKTDSFLVHYLETIIPETFYLKVGEEKIQVGKGQPAFTIIFNQPINKTEFMISTSLALGEGYMRGDIDVDKDLYEILNSFLGQMGNFTTDKTALKKLMSTSLSKMNQKKEVTSHYDIGNDFYGLWLDETMSYSCGYFKDDSKSLYEAQVDKVHHILEKLQLSAGMSLLDIGCGWGFLLIEAVKKYKVRGMGITLSQEQYDKFNERIKEEGLQDYLSVCLMDYRELMDSDLTFDRVVSVGMIEHVGRKNYDLFMKNVDKVLKPQGLFLLHCITALKEYPGDAWIKKYIFPGGMVPSLRELINLMPEYQFYTMDVESLRRHYNRTLLCWRNNFSEHREEITAQMGEEFTRMWDLYLCGCAATFNNGIIDLHQILISKGANNQVSMTRVV